MNISRITAIIVIATLAAGHLHAQDKTAGSPAASKQAAKKPLHDHNKEHKAN